MTQDAPTSQDSPKRSRRRWPWIVALGIVVGLVAVFFLGGGWFFSGEIRKSALDSTSYDPAAIETGKITAVQIGSNGAGTVTISRDEKYASETKNNAAVVGLKSGDTLLVAGPASSVDGASVTRPVTETIGEVPTTGSEIGLVRDIWLNPEQAGMKYEEIDIAGPRGKLPAWLIPGTDADRWAVLTHGKGASRSEVLRMAQPLSEAGYNILAISYSNDPGAPRTSDGHVHYGTVEWEDLQAAVKYALDAGAKDLVLGGASHGGAVTLGFMARSELANQVDALILDSPAASLRDVIDKASNYRTIPVINAPIPGSLKTVAIWLTGLRYGIDFEAVDYSGMPGLVKVPTLVMQGAADRTTPTGATDRFASAFPDQVKYIKVDGADHVLAWNLDPAGYQKVESQFLEANNLG